VDKVGTAGKECILALDSIPGLFRGLTGQL